MENTGCETLNKLWQVAIDCNINDPGIRGSLTRVKSLTECKNVRDFMLMATLKCYVEIQNKK